MKLEKLLAENMLRFGVKNLNNTDVQQILTIMEQAAAAGSQEDKNRADMNLSLVRAANEAAQLPGHKIFMNQVMSQRDRNNALSGLSSAQALREGVMTDLNRQGIAPSSSKAIYNDLKRIGIQGYNKFSPDSWGKIK
jgi:uncharacterized protein HemY